MNIGGCCWVQNSLSGTSKPAGFVATRDSLLLVTPARLQAAQKHAYGVEMQVLQMMVIHDGPFSDCRAQDKSPISARPGDSQLDAKNETTERPVSADCPPPSSSRVLRNITRWNTSVADRKGNLMSIVQVSPFAECLEPWVCSKGMAGRWLNALVRLSLHSWRLGGGLCRVPNDLVMAWRVL